MDIGVQRVRPCYDFPRAVTKAQGPAKGENKGETKRQTQSETGESKQAESGKARGEKGVVRCAADVRRSTRRIREV